MKETSGGLTDSEKKSLYIPKDLLEYTKIKQEEMENWLLMMEDPEVFRLMKLSGPN